MEFLIYAVPSVAKDPYLNNFSKQHIAHRNIFFTVFYRIILWKFFQQSL